MKASRLTRFIAPSTLVLLAGLSVVAATVVVVVYPGNLEGWQTETVPGAQPSPTVPPSVNFVTGPGTPPFGRGSAELRVGSDGGAEASLRHPNYAGTRLPDPSMPFPAASDELTALAYSTYVQSGGSGGQAPYLILNIDNNDDGAVDDLLFFEPVYQNGSYPTVDPSVSIPNQCGDNPACVVPGQWQTWNALDGGWWSLNAGTFGPPLTTLRFYRSQNPNARIVNSASGAGGVRIVAGGGAGTWDNFVGNVDAFRIGVGADPEGDPNITIYDFEPGLPPQQATGGVIISELRTSGPGGNVQQAPVEEPVGGDFGGPGARGKQPLGASVFSDDEIGVSPSDEGLPQEPPPPQAGDEYVELYNTAEQEIQVTSSDGSAGWALVKRGESCLDPPEVVAVIPNGTVIPARGHYLVVGSSYSLGGYAAGAGTTATGDQTLTGTIEGDRSVALFNTADTSNFTEETRLDAVGFDAGSGNVCDLLSEGTKLPPPRSSVAEYAYVRRTVNDAPGVPRDTDDNAADFVLVSTTPTTPVGDDPAPVLGAPGPENTTSPVQRNDGFLGTGVAPNVPLSQSPNRERGFAPEPCSDLGTLRFRRTFTNNTGSDVTRLRFRVVDITTFNTPNTSPTGAQADLRVRTSQDENVFVEGRGTVLLHGLQLEQPPNQPEPTCGGYNSSLSAGTITLQTPLAPGESIDVVFLTGIMQSGRFRIFVNIEALP
jgi:hypothetical protein